jgi:hypothetical protein
MPKLKITAAERLRVARKPAHETLIQIGRPLDGEGAWCIGFEITEREYTLFGSIVVYWSFLEHALRARTKLLATSVRIPIPRDASCQEFSKRLSAFNTLVAAVKPRRTRAKWELISSRIANAKGKRDAIAHHFLTYNPRRPDQLWSTNLTRGPGTRSEQIDEDRLMDLGSTLGEINFDLLYSRKPGYSFENYMSRGFRRMMMGKSRG